MTEKVISESMGTVVASYTFWVGKYMDKFYDNLMNKKIVGNKCPKCSKVFVPPRKVCNKCKAVIPLEQNWIDLPSTGKLVSYTLTPYRVSEEKKTKVKDLLAIGLVQIDGSSTSFLGKLLNIAEKDLKEGMKVKIEWAEKTTGAPSDIKGFVKA